jgi:hypothetical protein
MVVFNSPNASYVTMLLSYCFKFLRLSIHNQDVLSTTELPLTTLLPRTENSDHMSSAMRIGMLSLWSQDGWSLSVLLSHRCQWLRNQCYQQLMLSSVGFRRTYVFPLPNFQNRLQQSYKLRWYNLITSSVTITQNSMNPHIIPGLHVSLQVIHSTCNF